MTFSPVIFLLWFVTSLKGIMIHNLNYAHVYTYILVHLYTMVCSSTDLVLVCSTGHLDIVKYLVNEAHCDPDVKRNDGYTPLSWACQ